MNETSKPPSHPSAMVLQKGTDVEEDCIQIVTLIEHLTLGKVKLRVMNYISVFNWFVRAPQQGSETITPTPPRAVLLLTPLLIGIPYEISLDRKVFIAYK